MRDLPMQNKRINVLVFIFIAVCSFFLVWGLKGKIGFILELRIMKMMTLITVGAAIGVSSMVFQTISNNRILTPSIMGFEALFILMQTSLVLIIGGVGYSQLPNTGQFIVETVVMITAATILFGTLLGRGSQDIHRMILTGIILGILFRSLTSFLQRLIDPHEFSMVQKAMFASFGSVDQSNLLIAIILTSVVLGLFWLIRGQLDVMALGRNFSIGLGVSHDRLILISLVLVSILVSVSTALVGPIVFLGLLAASLAHLVMNTHQHKYLLPASALISATILVLGQGVFERLLGLQSTLSVIIEFFGGLFFLYLMLRGRI